MTTFVIKALAILFITAVLVLIINLKAPEYAFLLSVSGGGAVMILVISELLPHINTLRSTVYSIPGSTYFSLALKALGIAYLSEFIADTCRDFGQSSLAAKAELAGKCAIFILCVPPALNILEQALRIADI
ncbi:MAG: hypothetical protein J5852_09820 [Clostridia bacterium]|nr:hypothetical protein [Clostridia bacterium]